MTPHRGNTILFLSSSNSLVMGPWRAPCQLKKPFKGPQPQRIRCFGTTEKQGHRQVCHARRGGPRTASRTIDANLDCAFIKNALVFVASKIGRALSAPPTRTHLKLFYHNSFLQEVDIMMNENFLYIVDGVILTAMSVFGIVGTLMSLWVLIKPHIRKWRRSAMAKGGRAGGMTTPSTLPATGMFTGRLAPLIMENFI